MHDLPIRAAILMVTLVVGLGLAALLSIVIMAMAVALHVVFG